MWKVVSWVSKFITGSGIIDRYFDTVDAKIKNETDRDKIKGDIIKEHIRHRSDWMRSGGFWLLAPIGVIVTFYFGSVAIYSVFWHANGPFPQDWDIAAMPPVFMQWAGWYMLSIVGVVGINHFKK